MRKQEYVQKGSHTDMPKLKIENQTKDLMATKPTSSLTALPAGTLTDRHPNWQHLDKVSAAPWGRIVEVYPGECVCLCPNKNLVPISEYVE